MKFFWVLPFLFVTVSAARISRNRDANEDTFNIDSENAIPLGLAAKDSHANTGNLAMSVQGMAQQKDAIEQNQFGFRARAASQNRAANRGIGISDYVECPCSNSKNQAESEIAVQSEENSDSKVAEDSISERAVHSKAKSQAKSESDKSEIQSAKLANSNAKSSDYGEEQTYQAEGKGYGNLGSSYGSYSGNSAPSYGSSGSNYGSSGSSYGSIGSNYGSSSGSYGSSGGSYGSGSSNYGSSSNNNYAQPSYGGSSHGQSSYGYVKPVTTYNQQILVQRPSGCKQTNLLWKIRELVNESLDRARTACSNVENLAKIRTLLKVALSQGCGSSSSNSYKNGDESKKSGAEEKLEISQEKQSIALKSTNVQQKASQQNARQSQIAQNERPEKRAMGSMGPMGQPRAQMSNNNNRAHM